MENLDMNKDGKIEAKEVKEILIDNIKEAVESLKALAADEELSEKAKGRVREVLDEIQPKLDAFKMEAEIKGEKIKAEIEHRRAIKEKQEELK